MIRAELACSSLLVSWAGKVSASSKNVFRRAGKLVATLAAGDTIRGTGRATSILPSALQSRIGSWSQSDLLTPCQLASGASRCPCVRCRLSALQEAVGCNTESGERDRITPPDTGSNRKESIGKTPQRRNGRAGRADWRPSVTVDPVVIECPENCRNGIAGGKTSDLQVHKLAADCTTTKPPKLVPNWRQSRSSVDAGARVGETRTIWIQSY
jgi:hypothetical protein